MSVSKLTEFATKFFNIIRKSDCNRSFEFLWNESTLSNWLWNFWTLQINFTTKSWRIPPNFNDNSLHTKCRKKLTSIFMKYCFCISVWMNWLRHIQTTNIDWIIWVKHFIVSKKWQTFSLGTAFSVIIFEGINFWIKSWTRFKQVPCLKVYCLLNGRNALSWEFLLLRLAAFFIVTTLTLLRAEYSSHGNFQHKCIEFIILLKFSFAFRLRAIIMLWKWLVIT